MAFFSVKSDNFLQAQNLSLVLQQVMVVGVLATWTDARDPDGGDRPLCGTVMAFGQIVMTKLAVESGVNPYLAILLGILACVAFGVLNGGLVTMVRLPAFIVTLGTLNIAYALTHIYSNDETYFLLPSQLLLRPNVHGGGSAVTYGVVLMLVLYAIAWFVLTQTAWGATSTPSATTRRPRA